MSHYPDGCTGPDPQTGEPCPVCGGVEECDELAHRLHDEECGGDCGSPDCGWCFRRKVRSIVDLVDRRRQTHNASEEGAPF